MSFAEILFPGNAIGLSTAMNVLLPDTGRGPFPVFYLLHGLSDDHTGWMRRTSIERYMAGIPMIVVMPTTARGWYTNSANLPGLAYENHIMHDVIPFIDRLFPTLRSRKGRVIGGLSMGGYGALKLALKYPRTFCSAVSHSGAVMTPLHKPESRPKELQPLKPEFQTIFGKNWRGGPNDTAALAKKCPKNLRPALRLDCGTSDFLLQQNREFHALLQNLNYPHQYAEFPGDHNWLYSGILNKWTGDHDWGYWDFVVQEAIVFHCNVLGIKIPKDKLNPRPRR